MDETQHDGGEVAPGVDATLAIPQSAEEELAAGFERTVIGDVIRDEVRPTLPTVGADPTVAAQSPAPALRRALPVIPGYEILGELGRGGMGVVYRARQVLLNRPCALKMILSGEHASPEAILRFLAEAEAVARLRHPNVVVIHHIGESGGLPFFELEYCAGGSLDRVLDGTPRPPREAAAIVEQIARGMAEAHRLGLIHRDLKPANVLLGDDGTPKVTDFGLVKSERAESGLTRTDSILGSPSYMAPEQAGGHAREAGPESDVYSLGAILYELLTGRPPFRGTTVLETLEQARTAEPVAPSRLVPGSPRDLDTICLRCLEKSPERRYRDASRLAEELGRFLDGAPILSRPVSTWERAAKWARRRPAIAAMVAAVHVLLAALLVTGGWSYAEIRRALAVAEDQRVNALQAGEREAIARERAEKAATREADARSAAEASRNEALAETTRALRSETRAVRLAHEPGWRGEATGNLRTLAAKVADSPGLATLRSEAAACLAGFDVTELPKVSIPNLWNARRVRYSPDGTLMAIQDHTGKFVRIWDIIRGRLVGSVAVGTVETVGADKAFAFDFLPDGLWLAYAGRNGGIDYLPLLKGEVTSPPRLASAAVATALAFDATGRRVAVAWSRSGSGQVMDRVVVADVATGTLIRTIDGPFDSIQNRVPLALSPDGRLVAVAGPGHTIRLFEVDRLVPPFTVGLHRTQVADLAFDSSGTYLASSAYSGDQTVKVWDVAARREHLSLHGHGARVHGLAFSPDGELLASTGDDETVRLWDVRSGQARTTIHPRVGPLLSVAFASDGRIAIGATRTVVSYLPSDRRSRRLAIGHSGRVGGVAFDPGRLRLYSASHDRSLLGWDLGTALAPTPSPLLRGQHLFINLAISPDGAWLATCPYTFSNPAGQAETDYAILVLDLRNPAALPRYFTGQKSHSRALAFDPSGQHLAAGSDDGSLMIWDVATGQALRRGKTIGPFHTSAFLPPGDRLLIGGGKGLTIIRDVSRDVTTSRGLVAGNPTCFAVATGQNSFYAGCSDGAVRVVGLPDLATRRTIDRAHRGPIVAMALSPDNQLLVTAGGLDLRIVLRDAATLREILTFPDEASEYTRLAFDPGGRLLAIAGASETIVLWDLARVRSELSKLGLDWSTPASPAFPPPDETPSPRPSLEIDPGRLPDLRDGGQVAEEEMVPAASPAVYRQILAAILRDHAARPRTTPMSDGDATFGRILASVHLLAGDRPGFERQCQELLDRLVAEGQPIPAGEVAWACALAPGGHADPERIVRLSEKALREQPPNFPWWKTSLACALLRAGRLEEALQSAEASIRISPTWSGRPCNDLIRAIVQLHQGRIAEARASYDAALRAEEEQRQGRPTNARILPVANLQDALAYEILRREARTLLWDASFPADPFAR